MLYANIKKSIALIAFLFVLLMGMSSCSNNFLNVIPDDRIPKEAFFKNASDLESAVNGVYAAQREMYSGGELGMYNIEETRSDNTNQKHGRQTEHRAVDNFTADGGNTSYNQFWGYAYNVINLANAIIDRAPAIEMDEDLKNRLIGEARFIRGCTYFDLVQDFGGVPLRLKETKSLSGDNDLARSSVDSVYDVIISDLTFASDNLPDEYSGDDIGRATSGAALGMLGKVQLQKGNKSAAKTALQKVVDSHNYALLPDYSGLWKPGNKNTKESLFEIQFTPPKTGSPFWNFFAPPSLGVSGGTNGSVAPNTPTQDLLDAFESGDKRKAASISLTQSGRPYIAKFKDPGVSTGNDANVDFPVLRYADVLLMLAEAMGENPQSYHLINLVRNRAGLSNIDASTPGSFIEKLMHERQVELAFECQRWHDILRLGTTKAVNLMNAHLASEYPNQHFEIDQHDLLNPMPVSEMQSNSAMEDNPGY